MNFLSKALALLAIAVATNAIAIPRGRKLQYGFSADVISD